MKRILPLLLLLLMSCDMIQDQYNLWSISGRSLYYNELFKSLDTPEKIGSWIGANINPSWGTREYTKNPQETFESRSGNCRERVILFMNIAYYGMGYEFGLAGVDASRAIMDGGQINHAEVWTGSEILDADTGNVLCFFSIGYTYTFWEIF